MDPPTVNYRRFFAHQDLTAARAFGSFCGIFQPNIKFSDIMGSRPTRRKSNSYVDINPNQIYMDTRTNVKN